MFTGTKTKVPLRPETNVRLQRDLVWRVISRLAFCRSLYLSLRYKGVFLVARGTRLKMGSGARVTFEGRGFLCVGFFHLTPTPACVHIRKKAEMAISGTVQIMRGTRITVWDGGRLSLGSRTFINDNATITCFDDLRIGSQCAISWNANILDTNVHELSIEGVPRPRSSPVLIEDNVWVGTGVTILSGVTIGTGAVIAAGSVVTSDVLAASLVAGNPAKVVRKDVTWEL
jgi:acetyltransferase-like isoleucine patch superfamily enzyme